MLYGGRGALGLNHEDPAAGRRRDWSIPTQTSQGVMSMFVSVGRARLREKVTGFRAPLSGSGPQKPGKQACPGSDTGHYATGDHALAWCSNPFRLAILKEWPAT